MPRLPSPPAICIVADDLTGALDTGAPFAARGLRTVVRPWHEERWRQSASASLPDVLVIDTASRHVAARTAAIRARRAVELARGLGFTRLYKKVDSTLRGNVTPELIAFRRAARVDVLPFAPAWPRLGRTMRAGRLYVDGVPLERTAFGRDALSPAAGGHVRALCASEPALQPLDAETDADLLRIARALVRQSGGLAAAGSGGLAAAIARILAPGPAKPPARRPSGPVLAVNGSANPVAAEQVRHAVRRGATGVLLPPGASGRTGSRDITATTLLCASQLRDGRDVVLTVDGAHPIRSRRHAASHAMQTAALVADILQSGAARSLVVIGGDTIGALARTMRWHELSVAGALLPGVPLVRLPPGAPVRWLVTKAGGFGGDPVLARVIAELRQGT